MGTPAWNMKRNDVEYGGGDGLKKCSDIETGIKPIMVKDSGGSKRTMAWNSPHNDVEYGGGDGLKKCSDIETGIKPIMVKDSGGSKKQWRGIPHTTTWNMGVMMV